MGQLQHEHKRDVRPFQVQKVTAKSFDTAIASVSSTYKRDETLTENLRQQLLHRFKLFAIKLKNENMNRENGDFYEQCFNFLGNLIMTNIQGVSKEMFTSHPAKVNKTAIPTPSKPSTHPTLPTVTIKREDGRTFVKKFKCYTCNAVLPSLKHLERHSVQHTGEKPHICEVCNHKRFLIILR